MRISKFRVQNYKKVRDTGWVSCDDLTAFVGKNESGKSAIFRGLSKLNPSDNEKYDPLKEFPRRRFTSEFRTQDWAVASVDFELSLDDQKELSGICPILEKVTEVVCTRYYSWKLEISFKPEPELPDTFNKAYLNILNDIQKNIEGSVAPEGKGAQLEAMKGKLLPFLSDIIKNLQSQPIDREVDESIVSNVTNTVMGQINQEWQKEQFKTLVDNISQFREKISIRKQIEQAKEWIKSYIPKFIYFDRYDIIDSAVHIPTFIQQLNQNPSAPRLRATKCLFQHVGLELQELQRLDPTQPNKTAQELRRLADERAILMSSASDTMTQKFSEWWEQRKHKFKYQVDGPFFRIWVSDDLDPSDIELDQRSAGMQYFFSFYLVFLVEAKGEYRNSVLLLDDPGLHVHGTAQHRIVQFFEKLSQENQLLYTTHSPFMVDGDHLERVRVVYEDPKDGTTRVSEDIWPKDKDSLFPLQAALGYAIAQTLFISAKQLVVEGLTDYWILKAINEILVRKGMTALRNDAIIVPSGGVNRLLPLASILLGHDIKIAILLDGDEPGLQKGKEVEKKLLLECIFISSFAKKEEAEIEDLFDEELYLKAVQEAYPDIKLSFISKEKKIKGIPKRVQAAFKRIGICDFEKWRPARVITDWIQENSDIVSIDDLNKFERIFKVVNKLLE